MEAKILGWLQIIGSVLILWFDRAVFQVPSNGGIALVIIAVLFLVMGVHHLGEKKRKH